MSAIVPFEHQMTLANSFAKSNLFGIKTPDQALALMALCEAEGLHPAIAVRDYHIINNKPALKADAMLARFQTAGGRVKWIELNDKTATAEFSHQAGGSVEITWTLQMAEKAGLTRNPTWKSYPRQMLRSRVVSEGIRTVFPGCVAGVYTPEEMSDVEVQEKRKATPQTKVRDMGEVEIVEEEVDATEILNLATDAAEKGTNALRAFYKGLGKEQRYAISETALTQLREVAANVDAEGEVNENSEV
jgi:hypothetical protein